MIDISNKVCLVYDPSAGYTHMAEAVIPEFGQVLYYSFWETAFPNSKNLLPGIGIDDLTRVSDFFQALEIADLVVFPDVGNAGLQEYVRNQGIPVFGSASYARLEQDRAHLKETAAKLGLDVNAYTVIHGIDTLRKLLAKESDLYVKVSYLRGDMESYHHVSPVASKHWLDDVSLRMGPYGPLAEFIIEEPINSDMCVEIGADPAWVCDGRFPKQILFGYERKDLGYAGTIHTLPPRMRSVLDRLTPALAGYRGPLSTETRSDKDHDYLIDLTCRFPEPPSSVHSKMATNWGEMMYGAAIGEPVEPEYLGDYAVQLVLRSPWGAEHPLAVKVGEPKWVTLHGHCRIEGQDYAVSPAEIEEIGAACGVADSLAEAAEIAIEAANSVEGFQVSLDEGSIEKLVETIREGDKLGFLWGQLKGEDDHGEASA